MANFRWTVLDWWGRTWARVEGWWDRLRRGVRRGKRQLGAEARLLGAEVRQLGAKIWDGVDDLPFVPSRLRLNPVRTQFYGHGAFMGAAPALLGDARWRRILAFLMPDVFEQIRGALAEGAGPHRVMPMLENNPVMAAFGVHRAARDHKHDEDLDNPNHLTGIEWDVFVDGALIEAWTQAAVDPAARASIMKRILDTSLIAHASSADTVQEAMGIDQYRDVRKTPKTELGGVELDSWLDLFARALDLARADDLDAAVTVMSSDPRADSDEECMRHTFAPPWPVARAVEVHREVTGKSTLGVVLEIKSLRSTPSFLTALVAALNEHGVHVAAVASFRREEVEGVSATPQVVGGQTLPGPREIQFFHYAGDLQQACDASRVRPGQNVLFNGASLLDIAEIEGAPPVYSVKLGVVAELGEYRQRHDIHVGIYVQEGDCDHAAAALLADLVDARSSTFDLGFAWGGLRDEAGLPVSHDSRVGYGGQRLLEVVGKAHQWRTKDEVAGG